MRKTKEFALEAAKEITIAAVQGCHDQIPGALGELAADYFEAVYNKIYELAKDESGEYHPSL